MTTPEKRHEYYLNRREKHAQYAVRYYREHKTEMQEYKKEYYENNKKEISRCAALYYEKNRDEIKLRVKAYRERNPGKIKAHRELRKKEKSVYNKIYRSENKDKVNACQKSWLARNKERGLSRTRKWRARLYNAPGGGWIPDEEVRLKKDYCNRCAYCGRELPLSMDHVVPLSRGGSNIIENIVPACKSCNSSKKNTPLLIWMHKKYVENDLRPPPTG